MTTIGLIVFALLFILFGTSAWLNYQARIQLERENETLRKACSSSTHKQAEFRAAYRDLIGDYERLHARYKELQHDRAD